MPVGSATGRVPGPRLTTACSRRPSQSSNLLTQICRLSGARVMLAVRRRERMRLWSLHPKYLDPQGLVALWREALLAQAVLRGKTKGYRHHPQLERFTSHRSPRLAINAYLGSIYEEAASRGYAFDRRKIGPIRAVPRISLPRDNSATNGSTSSRSYPRGALRCTQGGVSFRTQPITQYFTYGQDRRRHGSGGQWRLTNRWSAPVGNRVPRPIRQVTDRLFAAELSR